MQNMSYKLESLCIVEKTQNKLEKVQGIIRNLVEEYKVSNNLCVQKKSWTKTMKIIRIIGLNLT